jgi:hypothetical protein
VADGSLRTFIAEWDRKIEKTIKSLRAEEHVEDIKQEIYLYMCQRDGDGKTGLEAYDPKKGALSSYVYRLVFLKTYNYKNKLKRDRLTFTPTGFEADLALRAQKSDLLEDPEDRNEFHVQIRQIAADLMATSDVGGGHFEDGRYVACDAHSVLGLLLEGRTRQEIVKSLRCSNEDLSAVMTLLSNDDRLRELARSWLDFDPTEDVVDSKIVATPAPLQSQRNRADVPTPPVDIVAMMIGDFVKLKNDLLDRAREIVKKEQDLERLTSELAERRTAFERELEGFQNGSASRDEGDEDQDLADEAPGDAPNGATSMLPPGSSRLSRITNLFQSNPNRKFVVDEVVSLMLHSAKATETTTKTYLTRLVKNRTIEKVGAQTYRLAGGRP